MKFHHLQALRGVAATLVVADHALGALIKSGLVSDGWKALFWQLGGFGVPAFFVISGFIMVHVAYDDMGSPQAAGRFLEKRFIRIVPAYWLATLLMFIFMPAQRGHATIADLLRSFFFVPYAGNGGAMRPLLEQGWTLNYEVMFYLAFALAMTMGRRPGLIFISALFGALAMTDVLGFSSGQGLGFYAQLIVIYFVIGIALGLVRRQYPDLLTIRHPKWAVAGLFALSLAGWEAQQMWPYPILGAIQIVACSATVMVCVFAPNIAPGRLERCLEALGNASYSTYLFHVFVLSALNRVMHLHDGLAGLAYVLLALIGSNCLGYAIYRAFEKPTYRLLQQWLIHRLRAA